MGGAAKLPQKVFKPIQQVGKIAVSAVREVGNIAQTIGTEVGKIGQAAVNDPFGTVAKIAAVSTGQWWALPLVSAGLVIANGGDIGQAALAAGISLAASGVAYGVGEMLGSAGSSVSNMMAQDAASMSAQGLSAAQIADTLASSYGVAANIASTAADLASMGLSATQIAADLGSSFGTQYAAEAISPTLQNALADIAANSAGSGARVALSGGSISDILSAAGTAGFGTGVGLGTTTGLEQAGVSSAIAGSIGAAAGAAGATAVSGEDGTAAFLNSLINTTLREAGSQTQAYLKKAWENVKTSVSEYNDHLNQTNELQKSLSPLQQAAKDAEDAVNAELDSYKPVRDQFSNLVTQYDAAVAAGNEELANSLAEQANALVPELEAGTDKYNAAYANYEAKLNSYRTELGKYEDSIVKADDLKLNYEKETQNLAVEANRLTEVADEVSKMPEPVQQAFSKLYANGEDVESALEKANQLNGMSEVAQETFNREFEKSPDINNALQLANQVNGLDAKQQESFFNAINQGLDNETAFQVAPVIANYGKLEQQAYANAVFQGKTGTEADLIAAFAALGGDDSVSARHAANLASLDDPDAKAAYRALGSKESPEDAMQKVQALRSLTGNVSVSMDDSVIAGTLDAPMLSQKELNDKYLANLDKAVADGRITAAERDQELSDLGISKVTNVLGIGGGGGQSGPNTSLIQTGTDSGGGGAQMNAPNSLYSPLSFSSDGAKTYYTGDGEVYSLVSIGGEPTLVNNRNPEVRIPIDLADVNLDTGQISAPRFPSGTTQNPQTPPTSGSGGSGGTTAPGGTLTGSTGNTGTSGGSSSTGGSGSTGGFGSVGSTGGVQGQIGTPFAVTDYLNKYAPGANWYGDPMPPTTPSTGTGTGTGTTTGTTPDTGTGTTTGTTPDTGTTTGTGTGTGSTTGDGTAGGTTGTGTGSGTTGTGTGSGTTGTGTGAGTSGTGTGTGTGDGAGAGTGSGPGFGFDSGGFGMSNFGIGIQGQGQAGGIANLTPGLTQRMDYTLSGLPTDIESTNPMFDVPQFAAGGITDYNATNADITGIKSSLTPGLTKAQIQYILAGLPGNQIVSGKAEGGTIEGHNPTFFSEGGLSSMENRYVEGGGDGTSDSVAAMLANGEFVIPADVVSKLGNGSNEAGAGVLDQFLVEIRKHAHSNGEKLPPESKGPLGYLLDSKRKVKA